MTTGSLASTSFGELVRRTVFSQPGRQTVGTLARALGLGRHSLYRKLRLDGRFTPEEIVVLLRELQNERLTRWMFVGSGILPVKYDQATDTLPNAGLLGNSVLSAQETVALLLKLLKILEHSHLTSPTWGEAGDLADQILARLLAIKMEVAAGQRPAAPTRNGTATFPALLSSVLLQQKGVRLRDLAEELGLSYYAMRARAIGEVPFEAEELRRLFRLYPEPSLADYFLAETRYVAVAVAAVRDQQDFFSPLEAGLMSLRALLNIFDAARHSVEPQAADLAASLVDDALRHMTVLRSSLTYIGRGVTQRRRSDALTRGLQAFETRETRPPSLLSRPQADAGAAM